LPEVLRVADVIRGRGAKVIDDAVARLEAYETAIQPLFIHNEAPVSVGCPFLEQDRCTIYEDRPLGCHGLNSVQPEVCRKWRDGPLSPEVDKEIDAVSVQALKAPTTACLSGILSAFTGEGRPSGMYELAGAVLAVLKGLPDQFDWSGPLSPLEKYKTHSELEKPRTPLAPSAIEVLQQPAFGTYYALRNAHPEQARRALDPLRPHPATFLAALDLLPEVYESPEEVEGTWQRLGEGIAAIEGAALPAEATFDCLAMFSAFFMAYAGKNVRPYMERFMGVACGQYAQKAYPELTTPLPNIRKPGRFRLGYAGYRLTNFNGTRWARGWLRRHCQDIETYAFNLHPSEDGYSTSWRRLADHYYHLPMTATEAAEVIRGLDLDALIIPDIGMDGINMQLGLLRLARRQFTAWGHPVTSGSPMIDGYLTSALMEPPNAEEHYTEPLIRLPGSGLCYISNPHAQTSERSAEELGLPSGGFLFCPQLHCKLLPSRDPLYKEIAERLGKPIVFLGPPALRDRLAKVSKLLIVLPRFSPTDYRRVVELAETILDPPDWNGGNSTIDALSKGRPVVSMAGEYMRGRHCLAFHTIAGVPGLIASDEADYIALACDPERQATAMANIHAEALYDDIAPVRKLDEVLLENGI
jgi:hypothetical protein